eukprot:Protomagalhaensia_sp_Gyna_25__5111@NODE_590_length_3048_cov_265_155201_g457_i0_p3_GENE_NODE_590_length_3048_cov_265_155201_g457_i0NODE_590_length_3048_cov_265_155201_g457_i0_p3_ORF_typecomplete_len141_score24_28ATP1G1_PLM_MAT8/PF02038_16/0_35_NODE_590_length_3048_cov_265_155201_g457_i012751697
MRPCSLQVDIPSLRAAVRKALGKPLLSKKAFKPDIDVILAQDSGSKWLLYGLGGATMISWIGGLAQGWPLLSMMRYGDDLMMLAFMGMGFALVLVVGGFLIVALRSENDSRLPPEGAEEIMVAELEAERRRRRRRRRRGD